MIIYLSIERKNQGLVIDSRPRRPRPLETISLRKNCRIVLKIFILVDYPLMCEKFDS